MGTRWRGPVGNRYVKRHEYLLLALMIAATIFGAVAYAFGGIQCVLWLVVVMMLIWYGMVSDRTYGQ